MLEVQKERPPYVTFEVRAVKDAEASEAAGRAVYKDTDFAIIVPIGGKDKIEREVVGWLEAVGRQVEDQRTPEEWLRHFKAIYNAWKEGQEIPLNGLSVKMWPIATPSDVKNLLDANIKTVEDLASANEEMLRRLGIGGRSLKTKAQAYLESTVHGRLAESFAELEAKLDAANLRIEALERENQGLLAAQSKAA